LPEVAELEFKSRADMLTTILTASVAINAPGYIIPTLVVAAWPICYRGLKLSGPVELCCMSKTMNALLSGSLSIVRESN
jgi:hypothetical protein